MDVTQIADYIGRPTNAYILLALLSHNSQVVVKGLLEELSKEIGDGIWTMPEKALHITLCGIIWAKPYKEDSQVLYETHKNDYENTPAKILKDFQPIKVKFNKIEVSPQAIFIRGNDDGSFNTIRQRLVQDLPLPEDTPLPPDIIHSTIARFTENLDLDRIKQIVDKYAIDCEEVVQEFRLINCLAQPLLPYRTIRTYTLEK